MWWLRGSRAAARRPTDDPGEAQAKYQGKGPTRLADEPFVRSVRPRLDQPRSGSGIGGGGGGGGSGHLSVARITDPSAQVWVAGGAGGGGGGAITGTGATGGGGGAKLWIRLNSSECDL